MDEMNLKHALREQTGTLNEVRGILEPIINSMMPIHTTLDEFEKGGPACRKSIEKIYERLLHAEQTINDGYYDYYDDD